MRLRSPWIMIVVAMAVLLFALASLVDLARRPAEVPQPEVTKNEALVSLAASPGVAGIGDEVTVTVHVQDVTNAYGGSFKFAYDPKALEVIVQSEGAVTPGDFFGDQPGMSMRNRADAETGIVEYALTLRQPATPVSNRRRTVRNTPEPTDRRSP